MTRKPTANKAGGGMSINNNGVRVAHIGNSIQYYNDCPRLLERMLRASLIDRKNFLDESVTSISDLAKTLKIYQDSCLRGGATLPSLWLDGNGMQKKFSSRPKSKLPGEDYYDIGAPTVRDLLLDNNAKSNKDPRQRDSDGIRYWDFVVVNDHTQSPVRNESKQQSMVALENLYLPTILNGMNKSVATPSSEPTKTTLVFVQTAAYKSHVKNSSDLGSFDDFTELLIQGYDEYVELVNKFCEDHQEPQKQQSLLKATVAPLGEAYRKIRQENFEMWSNLLYANDDFHPSPHGTLLEACLLYCIISGGTKFELFDDDNGGNDNHGSGFLMTYLWDTARYMQPQTYPDGQPLAPLPLPTKEEANYLNDVAYCIYLKQQQKERDHERGQGKSRSLPTPSLCT